MVGLRCALGDTAVPIEESDTYQVSVTNLQSLVDAVSDLTGSSLPCAISQLPVAQNGISKARHSHFLHPVAISSRHTGSCGQC
jgi:hypothetical protein